MYALSNKKLKLVGFVHALSVLLSLDFILYVLGRPTNNDTCIKINQYIYMDSQKQLKLCRFPQRTCKLMRLKVVI